MARLAVYVLALLVAGGTCELRKKTWPQRRTDQATLKHQVDLSTLFYDIHKPLSIEPLKTIANTFEIDKNIENYRNVTAVEIYVNLTEIGLLPRAVPFSILEKHHEFEAVTLFQVLFSAKNYDIFFKTAVHLRDRVNEGLYVYVLTTAIVHRHDTQGFVVPPLYEIFPSFFHSGEVTNETVSPNFNQDVRVFYFTQDYGLNNWYYNLQVAYPKWLGNETTPLIKDNRGELLWYWHKQLLARYYTERLSNGLGEIPDLDLNGVVNEGYMPGLLHQNGIPFPFRPNNFSLQQDDFVNKTRDIDELERRIIDAIGVGYHVNGVGERVSLRTPESIDVLGRLIEANADSPNAGYYQDFISIWKYLLGNSREEVYSNAVPLVLPSALELYQTALRDPAFYMIWKRVLRLFTIWHQQFPPYTPEELALPSVVIQDVETDKLETYMENVQVAGNVANNNNVIPRLNHKVYRLRVHVNSQSAQTVVVKFFMAPKNDSNGNEIPLHLNTENFFQLDQFTYDLPVGEHVINRNSTENLWFIDDLISAREVFEKAENALDGQGEFFLSQSQKIEGFPERLLLPKGSVGGMPFILLTYISEYHAPKVQMGKGFDQVVSPGYGSGARRQIDDPLGFPVNRPLHQWQIEGLGNVLLQDVLIYYDPTPEV